MSQPFDVTVLPRLETRRQFCLHACQAASVMVAGAAFAACGGSPTSSSGTAAPPLPSVPATVSGRVVSITVDSSSVLSSVGSAATAATSLGAFLVSRTAQDAFTVLTATCTHEGCTITGFQSSRYVCPCHGSQFTTAGAVTNGPATTALRVFPSQFANNVLTFTA